MNYVFDFQGMEIIDTKTFIMLYRGRDGGDYFLYKSDLEKIISECNAKYDIYSKKLSMCQVAFDRAINVYLHLADGEIETGIPE
jgi:hypothetical protein